jgi:hypothetical protein
VTAFLKKEPAKISEDVQGVRVKGIQNKIIISKKAFIIHIYGLHHYNGKLSKFFFEYITFPVNFNVGSLGGMTNVQTIFDLVPRCLKHVWCYHSHSVPYAGFQVFKVIDLYLVNKVLHITPEEKSNGVKSGDSGGQVTGSPLPMHFPTSSLLR